MQEETIKTLITDALSKTRHSITTDWLFYCIDKDIEFEVISDCDISEKQDIKNGVPAVGTITIIDNDFYELQSEEWKKTFVQLCQKNFTVCIDNVLDVSFLDKQNVSILKRSTIIKFANLN